MSHYDTTAPDEEVVEMLGDADPLGVHARVDAIRRRLDEGAPEPEPEPEPEPAPFVVPSAAARRALLRKFFAEKGGKKSEVVGEQRSEPAPAVAPTAPTVIYQTPTVLENAGLPSWVVPAAVGVVGGAVLTAIVVSIVGRK